MYRSDHHSSVERPLRIAVSGASGLVGFALCDLLAKAGHDVVRLVRNPLQAESPNDCHWIPRLGVQQPEKLARIDGLVHLAGRSVGECRWTVAEKKRIRDSRVEATQILANQLSQSPSNLAFISASATGFYGDCGSRAVTEATPNGDGFLASVARDWEAATQPLVSSGGRVAIARLGVVLSPKAGALAKMLPLFKFCLAGPLGGGKQYWSWIALEDAIGAIHKLVVDQTCEGAYNLVAPQSVTNAEFTRILARVLRRPAVLPTPAFALRLALGKAADELLLSSCRVAPERLLQMGFEFAHPELEPCLKSQLGRCTRSSV